MSITAACEVIRTIRTVHIYLPASTVQMGQVILRPMKVFSPVSYPHRWALTSILISAMSDTRHRHLLFRYRKKICRTENCYSVIGRVPISTSYSIPISAIKHTHIFSHPPELNPRPVFSQASTLLLSQCTGLYMVGCRISDIGLKFVPISDIMSDSTLFSPISKVPISSSDRYR